MDDADDMTGQDRSPPDFSASAGAPEPPHAPMPALRSFHADFADFQERYVRASIGLAETKATWTFSIAAGVLVFLLSAPKYRNALLAPHLSLPYLSLVGAVILLAIATFFAVRAVPPRLASKSGETLVSFDAVASRPDASAYVLAVASCDESALIAARLEHCFDISLVCQDKHLWLRSAGRAAVPALLLFLVAVFTNA